MPCALFRPPYRLRSFYERPPGTEVELQIVAASRPQAEAAALNELERLNAVLSRFDPHSEWRRIVVRPGETQAVSPDLRAVMELAEHWRRVSDGASLRGARVLQQDALAVLNDLHKGRNAGGAWKWLIDRSGVVLALVTGIGSCCF